MGVEAQYFLLLSSLCTLGVWRRGLKERPYQCPPGPRPPWESVSPRAKGDKEEKEERGEKENEKIENRNEQELVSFSSFQTGKANALSPPSPSIWKQ